MAAAGADRPPERLFAALADGSRALTWGEMAQRRDAIAHSLAPHLPSDPLAGAVYGKNSPEWLMCNLVCGALGLRFTPINWHLVGDEIAYIVRDSDADLVFFDAEFAAVVAGMRPSTPRVAAWVCMDGPAAQGAGDCLSLEDLVAAAPPGARPLPHRRAGGTLQYTGGTTGRPKGALRSGAPQASADLARRRLEEWGMLRMMPHPVQLVSAPMYHAMPMAWFSIGCSLHSTFVCMAKFDAAAAFAAIGRFGVNGFYMPPILLKRLMQTTDAVRAEADLSSVRTVMSSGAACPTFVKEGITSLFGPVLYELYGASELGGVAVMSPEHMLRKPLSVGRPAAGYDVVLLDEQRRRISEPNTAGEIFARGFNIDGYHKLGEKTQESTFEDYFSVGDIGYFDEEGFLYISDRKIDMIVSGGVNIYPAQVEEVLHRHPDVEDAAVFGVPDADYGERVHAAVRLRPGRALAAAGLLAWCDGKIGRFQLPREADITFHAEDFPRSDAGKLRKRALRDRILAGGVGGAGGAGGAAPRSRL